MGVSEPGHQAETQPRWRDAATSVPSPRIAMTTLIRDPARPIRTERSPGPGPTAILTTSRAPIPRSPPPVLVGEDRGRVACPPNVGHGKLQITNVGWPCRRRPTRVTDEPLRPRI